MLSDSELLRDSDSLEETDSLADADVLSLVLTDSEVDSFSLADVLVD